MRLPERVLGLALLLAGLMILKYWAPSAGPPGARRLWEIADRGRARTAWDGYLVIRRYLVMLVGCLVIVGGILYLVVPPAHLH